MTMVAGQRLGPYEIQSLLGAGGMGEVYKARDTRLDRTVAIKVLPSDLASDPYRRARFEREAKTIASLNHAHICTLHDVGQQDGTTYLVMEHLVGESLADRLRRGPLPLAQVLEFGAQIGDALAAAHRAGIVHRDLKPANVMLVGRGRTGSGTAPTVKLLDFGLAKLSAHGEAPAATMEDVATETATLTGRGTIVGTLPYMAPEQVQGQPADARTDIWALGAILYEMATGVRAFDAGSAPSLIAAILAQEPPSLTARVPLTPPSLERTVRRCLAKQPDDRWAGAHDVAEELRGIAQDLPERHPAAPQRTRQVWAWGGAGVMLLLLAAAATWWSVPGRTETGGSAGAVAAQRTLSRITFEPGLQTEPTWSSDGQFLAYTADPAGNLDIWVQQVRGGRPVQVTTHAAHDRQPAWSPDGQWLAFRSERDGGGVYLVPPLGGRERRVASFGYRPQWSPDGATLLVLDSDFAGAGLQQRAFVVALDGGAPREVARPLHTRRYHVTWSPWPHMVSFWAHDQGTVGRASLYVQSLDASVEKRLSMDDQDYRRFAEAGIYAAPFRWAPSGTAIYFEAGGTLASPASRGFANLWRVLVDDGHFSIAGPPERLTGGTGRETGMAVSRDGHRMAFTSRNDVTRPWTFPFDAAAGSVMAEGSPISLSDSPVGEFALSRDGTTAAYCVHPVGKDAFELWQVLMGPGQASMLADAANCAAPRFSLDGTWVSWFQRGSARVGNAVLPRGGVVAMPTGGGEPRPIADDLLYVHGWSPDGASVVGTCRENIAAIGARVCVASIGPGSAARALFSDPKWDFWQANYSPDGRWILFVAVPRGAGHSAAVIGVGGADGGAWVRLTQLDRWADKPRWSPDGKVIYFIANFEPPFLDVWGLRFDTATGQPGGEPFRVTRYTSASRRLASIEGGNELGISAHRLVVSLQESTGNIWVLDNVDK
jgi:eukaryotic-like serine/threonine-protein kinase